MSKILTDWLTIATAGNTVDGREIKEQWLIDAAETYDPEEYVAFVNVEHYGGNLGAVHEVRLQKDKKGRTCLQARLRVNKYYLTQNAEDYRLCFSVELLHNFCGTGKTYLVGLATTDYPASVGTTEARFSLKNNPDFFRCAPVEVVLTNKSEEAQEPGIVSQILNGIKEIFTSNQSKQEEQEEMTKEELKEALTEAVKPLSEMLGSLADKLEELSKKDTQDADPAGGKKNDEFNAKDAIEALTKLVEGFETKLTDALKKQEKELPPATGTETDNPLI